MSRVPFFAAAVAVVAVMSIAFGQNTVRRPVPYPVVPDREFRAAVDSGTRTMTGMPGPKYWQNSAEYKIRARVLPDLKRLQGRVNIVYRNNSPDTLRTLRLSLLQNFHAERAMRLVPAEVTGGMQLNNVVVNGDRIDSGNRTGARYVVNGTTLIIWPAKPTPPRSTAALDIDFEYKVPQDGISGRMGYNTDSLFYFAYWYPQMTVLNDVVAWEDDQFFGGAEFYADFGNYEYTLEMPDDWLLHGTGVLQNPKEVLTDETLKRIAAAEKSDTTVRIVGPEDFGKATRKGTNGWLSWRFKADNVRDVAWLATRSSIWEGARVAVGDRNNDGKTDYAMAYGFWRPKAFRWANSVQNTRRSIAFLSSFTGIPYPWPHMTAVEAGGIIGGGMEYPMMTLIGDYNRASDEGLLGVHAHEEAHMWVPMIVNVDERRYGWMDEGTTSFHTTEAMRSFQPDSFKPASRFSGYVEPARVGFEGEIMRWSNFHYNGGHYGIASYPKPASILHMLRGVLGEDVFTKAYRRYMTTWAWKHPYPWDMFNTFSNVSGKDLDWFIRSWYYETWTLDQAVEAVRATPEGTEITIADKGWVPMPVLLTVTRADSSKEQLRISEAEWLSGKTSTAVRVKPGPEVVRVEIDPEYYFADIDRSNNVWKK